MRKERELERLADALRSGGISRRDFVRRATVLGLGAGSIGALLSACGGGEAGGRGGEGGAGADGELGPIGKELHIYNWSDYIAEDTVPGFEKEFGVTVTYDTYESNEEMVAKLQAGASGYDIIVPSGYIIPVLVAIDLIAPLVKTYLTNWGNVSPIFQNLPSDPDNAHSVPWQWGTSGIAYRTDRVTTPVDSWAVFHDPRHRDKMTMMDDGREVIGAFLRYRGHSLNSTDPRQLAGAKADAIRAKQYLKAYLSAPVKAQLISGDVWISQLWNGDTSQARTEQPNLAYAVPREGCTIWADSMCVPRAAPNKRAAHEWMNYILRPEVGAAISNATGYGTPNAAAAGMVDAPVPYPTREELERLEYQVDLGRDTAVWDRIWTEIKSA
jgi:spermidine/putrescine transport system substrate-binding protein